MHNSQQTKIVEGLFPGLLGDVAAMHGRDYADAFGFPVMFEQIVARGMADFFARYDATRDLTASVVDADSNSVLGSITLDGSDPQHTNGEAHLRWFIMSPSLRGQGLGKELIGRVVSYARAAGYRSIYLDTFDGLPAAAALYRRAGFEITHEAPGSTWGKEMLEQRFELIL